MSKRILIVTEYFYPNNLSTSYHMTDITEIFCKSYECKVITATELEGKKELAFLDEKIIRLKGSSLNNTNVVSRVLRSILFTFKLSWKIIVTLEKNDVIFSVTNPAFMILMLAIIKKVKKVPYTLLVYDVFPENAIAAGLIKKDTFLYKIAKKIFNWSYRQADQLIVIGRDMEEIVMNKTNNQVPLTLITNWTDTKLVIPMAKNENLIIKKFKLEEKIVFAFTGNLGRVQGIQNLLAAADLVEDENFVLLFIGDGVMRTTVEKYIDTNPNGNVIYGGSYPSSEQNLFLNACDIAIVSLSHSMYGLGVPSKSYYNMASGKPLLFIGDEKSEIGRVVEEENIGWIVEPNNANILAQTFENICQDNLLLQEMGIRSRNTVEKYYSKDIILKKYKKLYEDMK